MTHTKKLDLIGGRMKAYGVNQKMLAAKMCTDGRDGRNPSYVSKHLRNPQEFLLGEIYIMCDELEIPYEEIPKYFPKEA